ncbi:M23 family metallopeptidase [Bacillus aquiflavi]|uniref:M23 family metallopeptidase n=1 Tax=Bacillus aquiflavi TaxID=2672567 RepID=A0A6B3VST2_9BACI|nr:M23 family metallopeptidase [Bacillus aquiflavi]MBA4536661.1 M23 family metallopeptidase [Bacillus aquiflavi]NEY81029.1 M23 family metallopeptidase [Bacillus aquiflavi]
MREEEKKRPSQDSKFFRRRWVFPAIYIASAAIILTGVFWYQNSEKNTTDSNNIDSQATDITGKKYKDELALEVNRSMENFVMPVMNPDSAVIKKQFYDSKAKKDEQEAALVFYNNKYHQNTGIDIAMKKGETFDVVAALSGNVKKVEEDSLLGNVIVIEHDKGIVTQYQAVKDIKVKVGDFVKQGQALAKAGQSLFNQDAGVHVHFEIRKDNIPVNPLDYFDKPLSSLLEQNSEKEGKSKDEQKPADEGKSEDDQKPADGGKSEDDQKPADEGMSEDDQKPVNEGNLEDKKSNQKQNNNLNDNKKNIDKKDEKNNTNDDPTRSNKENNTSSVS